MTSAIATEFLTKQLSIEKETVTFRWLSRKLSVHVNVAKNELASFYASSRTADMPVHATYLLTGDVAPVKAAGLYRDNVEDDMEEEDDTRESVATSKIILVGENDLEVARAQFTRTPSVHIYSLSPSAISDAALLAPMADRVRPDDASKGKAYNRTIGIVVGPDVKISQTIKPGTAKLAKTHPSASSSQSNAPAAAKNVAEKPQSSEKGKASEIPKQEEKKKGALDWSKAKVKGEKEKEQVSARTTKGVVKESKSGAKQKVEKLQQASKTDEDPKAKVKKEPPETLANTKKTVESDKPKRGTKRPFAVMSLSDSEDDQPPPKTRTRISASPLHSRPSHANGVKVKKGVLLSDDDEDYAQEMKPKAAKQKGKGRAHVPEEEMEVEVDPSIRAMMDLDDSEVTRHNNRVSAPGHQSDEDVMLSDEESVPTRPKVKRKPKKVIPVGKNGLPKRRVVKSRKSKNAKGYTITEDYSSYESVSETEQVQLPSDTEKRSKKSKKKSLKVGDTNISGTSEANGCFKSKDIVNDHSGMTEEKSQNGEGKPETMKPGSGSGGSTSKAGAKASNGGKNNLMSYFTKK